MAQAAAGLDELYAAHAAALNRYMLKLTGSREEAEDLVQDIFLKLCLQDCLPEHPKAWLFRAGYRLFVDHWRRKRRFPQLPLDPGFCCPDTPEQAVLDREFERLVRQLLLRLKPETRAAFFLRVYEQTGYGDIARRLGCPENTVKTRIRRGKARIFEWLGMELRQVGSGRGFD